MKLHVAILWGLLLLMSGVCAGLFSILILFGLGPFSFSECYNGLGGMPALKKAAICLDIQRPAPTKKHP